MLCPRAYWAVALVEVDTNKGWFQVLTQVNTFS